MNYQRVKPRCWWQFSDSRRIQKRLNKLKDGGILYFAAGIYKLKKPLLR